MASVIEIEPDKKYIIVFNEPMTEKNHNRFVKWLTGEFQGDNKVIVIAGDVTIVPADQVVGYVPFKNR